jgi:hypothetical protein
MTCHRGKAETGADSRAAASAPYLVYITQLHLNMACVSMAALAHYRRNATKRGGDEYAPS